MAFMMGCTLGGRDALALVGRAYGWEVNARDTAVGQGDGVAKVAVDRREEDWQLLVAEVVGQEHDLLSRAARGGRRVALPLVNLAKVWLVRRGRRRWRWRGRR